MKFISYIFIFTFAVFTLACNTKSTTAVGESRRTEILDSVRLQALVYMNELGGSLKSNLKQQLALDSTGMQALDFCKISAVHLQDAVNKGSSDKIKVRRTALKFRNANNKPDEIDIEVMKTYLLSANKKSVDIVETHNGYRVYKPLFVGAACLKCHGQINELNTELVANLKKAYPLDEAIGYKLGDFRGVIVADVKR